MLILQWQNRWDIHKKGNSGGDVVCGSDDFSSKAIVALLSSMFTAGFVWLQRWGEEREQKRIARQNLAKAIYSEISTLVEIYKQMELTETPPQVGTDLKIAYLTQDYISVYENNLDKIGILDTDDIEEIVKLYICIKALIDSHIYLAKRWEMYAQYTRELNKIPKEEKTKEEQRKKEDVNSAHRAALGYQKEIYKLYPGVLDRLKEYDTTKED